MSYPIPQEYELYLDRLVESAHGTTLPQKLKDEMKCDLYGRLENFLLTSFIKALPNEASDEFEKIMDGEPDADIIQAFFKEKIQDVQEVSARALLEFRDVYLGAAKNN